MKKKESDEEFFEFLENASFDDCVKYLKDNSVDINNDIDTTGRINLMKSETEVESIQYERTAVFRWIGKMKKVKDSSKIDIQDRDLLEQARKITVRYSQEVIK